VIDPAEVLRQARQKVEEFFDGLIDVELSAEWADAAGELYKEQFAKKENPYGEAWEYRPGDEKRTKSYYKFGAPDDVDRDGFSLVVAGPNPNRSCVPFEPRGLGVWRPKFEEIFYNRMRLRFSKVRP
jgi:hypothetical protein